ncbi:MULTISPECIES: DUF885 domain-containing protein [unclassified Janthinobacterium]|uniref:DUF885 domain-containing protein n=1 Tax=unclassified Janthinobacterium TaxID=2610881 RepID=UPI0016144561|nr:MULTISPECIES: DUF885 domain-containing protein [unclassified Janthinobacterium]MBB5368457.1 hypothetical protein [Janthinobacterium sp. K2C7]MBB5382007.1 hypothetical protein [Janthinobacterium sp. K2Li3]MBB5386839.1 hypothetical protein [Janthinobacterium sp. K2E3]
MSVRPKLYKTVLAATLAVALATAFAAPATAVTPAASTAWVEASNRNAAIVLEAQAQFSPENASDTGLSQYDGLATDLGPKITERYVAAMRQARIKLQQRLAAEKDERIRQDLEILTHAVDNEITGAQLDAKYTLPWVDVPQLVFGSMQSLLQEQRPAARRAKALELLQRYVGQFPGSTPITAQAKARFTEKIGQQGLAGPVRLQVEQSLDNVPTYIAGIRKLFADMKIAGAEATLALMEQQLNEYAAWERQTVLPLSRTDFRMAPELYAFRLKQVGIDIAPQALIERAEVAYLETRAALQALAPVVAARLALKGIDGNDYRQVLRALKSDSIPNDQLEAHYKDVNTQLEARIRQQGVVDLPQRAMTMRLASAAESAAQPAPHMRPPPLIGNTGEHGQFVLTVSNPATSGKGEVYDDFNFSGAAWTLSAHEGRPGHELQFSAMVERGVSQARSLYAFNSVNVEGWALYAEAEMLPYEPVEGQFIALQFRMLRAARAMLDPMLNLGQITREEAGRILTDEVMLSKPMARQELDRYTFNMPGQAGSYFYGYTRILQLRAETELALGAKFDRLAFNNFLLGQGLLPPDLLAKAVREQFIPAQKARG